ncbi:MAG: DegT/DnrJ/EryC1/StrS family aminotransferase [Candidatus Omnitrophica bacterium]|nr:DegT/DnrJ/EryC1/StrS family aminotransferase [Candidatus Omnitrophota bacterium]MCM8827898.1 DegT/DnrJ/EryC1/StrS family aminotransferase [Candidatus Omnitrophota bacterium]
MVEKGLNSRKEFCGLSETIGVGDFRFGKLEKNYIKKVIQSNRLSYGPMSKTFESRFAAEHQCRFGIFCNSGTSALHISIAALKEKYGWRDGDEILVPAITFIATSNVVLHNNLVPVFVDVDRRTYNINPDLIEDKITSRTRAIIPAHLFGLPCDMASISEIARKHRLRIIEDSCETMFASYKGRRVGSFGDTGCFSTYIAHFLVTGVGGLCTTNDSRLAVILKSLMNHGRDSIYISIDDDNKAGRELFKIVERRFRFIRLGHSFRATELEAAIGLAQLEKKEEIISRRRRNANYLTEGLKDFEEFLQLPFIPADREHNFMMYPIVLKKGNKNKIVRFLEENRIETRDMMPLLNQPVYVKLFGDIEKNYPVARWINDNGFYIGCHQYLKTKHLDYVIERFHQFFKKNG